MITNDTLMAVQVEVTRFQFALDVVCREELRRYKAAEITYRDGMKQHKPYLVEPWIGAYSGSSSTAALRRASMDLTRALADLRRST